MEVFFGGLLLTLFNVWCHDVAVLVSERCRVVGLLHGLHLIEKIWMYNRRERTPRMTGVTKWLTRPMEVFFDSLLLELFNVWCHDVAGLVPERCRVVGLLHRLHRIEKIWVYNRRERTPSRTGVTGGNIPSFECRLGLSIVSLEF